MRASDRAYEALKQEIVSWQLPPGATLAEVEQATRLGISRTPLREALSRLVADGLATPTGGRGLVVSEVSAEHVTELYEARQALEQQAARLAAQRRDRAVFVALRDEFATVSELLAHDAEARAKYFDMTRRLDDAMDEATANSFLVGAIRGIRMHMVRIRRVAQDNVGRLLDAGREHQQIVEALIAGDPDLAASATHVHLHASLLSVLAHIGAEGASYRTAGR